MAWKTVFTTFSVVEAKIMAARLEDEGIQTYTRQEAAGMAYGLSSGLMGQIDVLVPDSMAEQALAIVDDLRNATVDTGTADDDDSAAPPE